MSKKIILISFGFILIILPIIESKLSHKNDETDFITSFDSPRIAAIGSFGEDDADYYLDEDNEDGSN